MSEHDNRLTRWAEAIVASYATNRGAGNTYHQEHGWLAPIPKPFTKTVVVHYAGSSHTVDAAKAAGCRVVGLTNDPSIIAGVTGPLMVDHNAMATLLAAMLKERKRHKDRIYRLEKRLAEVAHLGTGAGVRVWPTR